MIHPDVSTCDVFASVSGGKDSTAMCLHLKEQGIPYRAVFADTGWEHSVTYDYLRGLDPVIGPIQWVRAEVPLEGKRLAMAEELEAMLGHYSAMVRTALHKGMMPARTIRWCTAETKAQVLDTFMALGDREAICANGIRAAESTRRAHLGEWEFAEDRDLWVWRPLIRWTTQDVIDIHLRHGLKPNPLYLTVNARRVGCWPCINSRKSEILAIATTDPTRIEVIRRLERFVGELARERIEAAGREQVHTDPTWFQAPALVTLLDGRTGYAAPIDDVVAWSKTGRGGNVKQVELFMPRTEPGCIRWGMCDFAGDDDE
jgi:3'-phosphoadenosine 5'-phosphosulfate sulfotransferase (PAPS reductase)/FAD synthetase